MIVVCNSEVGSYRQLAAEIAADNDTEVVDSVAEAGDGPLLYVTEPTDVDEAVVLSLQQRLAELGPDAGGFGVITGHTASAARKLYERGAADGVDASQRSEHSILLREETNDWFSYDDETSVSTGDDVTVADLGSTFSDLESLSMLVHGRSMHFFFGDGLLCGFPKSRPKQFDGPQPYCVTDDGQMDCPLEGNLLHADEIRVPHQFVDSCASMLPENDYEGVPVHVGMGLLDGATNLISAYRQIDSLPQLSLLHYCLVRAGYTGAERCYLLNHAASTYNTAVYPYMLFGHPETVASSSGDQSVEVESIEGNQVTLRDVDAHVVDVRLDLPVSGEELYVRNRTDALADAPVYAVAFESGDGVRLLVYTWGRFELDELVLEVDASPVRRDEQSITVDALGNADRLRSLNFLDSKAKGQLKDLRNRIEGFGDDVHEQRYDVNAHREVGEQISNVTDALGRIEDRVRLKLEGRYSTFLSDDYREDFRRTATNAVDRNCPNCGRGVFEKRMESASGVARRLRDICPLCGVTADVPALDGPVGRPRVDGELVPVHDDVEIDVAFRNRRDVPVRATYVPWLGTDNDEYRGRDVFEPDAVTTRLAPGEQQSVTFEVDVSDLEPNEYWVCGYVLGNLNVYQGLRKMVVGTDYGHLRNDLRKSDE